MSEWENRISEGGWDGFLEDNEDWRNLAYSKLLFFFKRMRIEFLRNLGYLNQYVVSLRMRMCAISRQLGSFFVGHLVGEGFFWKHLSWGIF